MENTQLIIEITEARMSAYKSDSGKLQSIATLTCVNKSDAGYKQTLIELLSQCGNPDVFTSFSCSYSGSASTLVPMSLFSESKPEILLNLTVHIPIPKGETDYNRIPEWNMVNVYHLPLWIKSALIIKIPRIVIQHELTHALRGMNAGSPFSLSTLIILQEGHFCCVIRKDAQVVHASYQLHQTAEDLLYHLLYCFQSLEITSRGEIQLSATTTALAEQAAQFKKSAESIEQFRSQTIRITAEEHLKYQTLCV